MQAVEMSLSMKLGEHYGMVGGGHEETVHLLWRGLVEQCGQEHPQMEVQGLWPVWVNAAKATQDGANGEEGQIEYKSPGPPSKMWPEESRATLSAQHASKEHHVAIHTLFVEPFNPIIGAQYIVLGEVENADGVGAMVRARVLNCVDGVNVALLQKAINEQRSFFREREHPREDARAT
ncbi:CST complex subunit TEN1 [Liparis tanakae]|uniref:CST complex subunit TEN1 n=1 Tax=Liparis tanakae TaxID=230148 RepID=A0A4Z2HUY6_9TELE|nr:CST complex subunit TEN1 [Liparis tanakae]